MRTRSGTALATAVVLVLALTLGRAATPIFWHVSTQAEFLKGEVENLSIDGDGRLILGPATEVVHETAAPFLWILAAAPDGALWAGSGNEGKVFRIDENGEGSTFFDAAELEVHALAAAPDGELYVGTSPDGQIYRVDANGSATTLFDPEEMYIWALAIDPDGSVYAATGDKGTIYKITPDGEADAFYRTEATHVVSLTFDHDGNLLAGTEAPGQVFRIDPQGQAFVLLDSAFREIRALNVDREGVIYAAALNEQPAGPAPPTAPTPTERPSSPPVPSVSTEVTAITVGQVTVRPPTPGAAARPERGGGPTGAVYRIAPDGVWDIIWESREDLPYDLTFDANDALVIGTGSKGKIYHVSGDPSRTVLLTRAAAQQVTAFLRDRQGQNYFATANPGKIFKLSPDRAARGSYESEVRDAKTVAAWGTIRWRATAPEPNQIQLFSRSGNTATPNETWSAWSEAYTDPDGEQITSPKARYLQWKAMLSGNPGAPVLTSVTTAYLPRNLRPVVTDITVHPPGTVFQRPFPTGEPAIAGLEDTAPTDRATAASANESNSSPAPRALGRRAYRKGLQTFVWKAEDGNDDRLEFDVLYRREGETSWTTLKRGLQGSIFTWDTTSVPDGTYLIKVAASDQSSNSPDTALTGELESTTFDIDNSPPRIDVGLPRREGERRVLPFLVRDDHSPVQLVEFSMDANRWQVIYPTDGIPDSRTEEFAIVLDGELAAARRVIIRATDAMNNAVTAAGDLATSRDQQ